MTSWLQPDLITLAFCWRLDRRDGVTLGFTSHDRDLMLGGLRYRATPGMRPSALEMSDGLEAHAIDLSGALTSDAIRSDDLMAGRWDAAALKLYMVDWTQPDIAPLLLTTGTLGAIEVTEGQFTASLNGSTQVLDISAIEATGPMCRATLGDRRCRVDMAGRERLMTISSTTSVTATLLQPVPGAVFTRGRLRWADGPNAGLESAILRHENASLILANPPHFPVTAPTRAWMREGCDNQLSTCVSRFQNAANFRGEPHLPGNDLLTRYAS